ncbi:MAG: hypothetical protein WBA57_04760 [Elainellaceae cyanobacterium]
MTPYMLRQLWTVVDQTQTNLLLTLDESSLSRWLIRQLSMDRSLSTQETDTFEHYIRSKIPLIRDLAQTR